MEDTNEFRGKIYNFLRAIGVKEPRRTFLANNLYIPIFLICLGLSILYGIFLVFPGFREYIPLAKESLTPQAKTTAIITSNPIFRGTRTIYSNFVPVETDIIDLDHSGTLTPSPLNLPFSLSPKGICVPTGPAPIDYPQGIVLVLDITPVLSSNPQGKLKRSINFNPPPNSNFFTFKVGETHKIKTSNERIFFVKLSRINDLSTKKNGQYFSYVFDMNEDR